MIVEKKTVIYVETELEIKGVTLLSTDEAEVLPLRLRKYNNWWLRSPGFFSFTTAIVHDDGSIDINGNDTDYGSGVIRPALKISKLEASGLEIGDVFLFDDKEFEVISDSLAFCTTDIGKHQFDANSNDYEKSEIKKYVDEWFEQSKRLLNRMNKVE